MRLIHDHPKPPVGGHHFTCHGELFRGKSAAEVVARLTEYRTHNSLPLGDPEGAVAAYYKEFAPHLVNEAGEPAVNSQRQLVAEKTMAISYGKFPRLTAHDPVAEDRLAHCKTCPHCRHDFGEPTTPYWDAAATKAVLMTGNLEGLMAGWCTAHHWLNCLGCRLVEPAKVALMPAPPECWLTPHE